MAWAGGSVAGEVAVAIKEERGKNMEGKTERGRRWECVKVGHHKDIGRTIGEWEKNGWRLHTYQAQGSPTMVNHYLLFVKEGS